MTTALAIDRIGPELSDVVANLFQYYLHDMAEWFRFDVGHDGRYDYDMSAHWSNQEPVYLARVDGALAGFAIVASAAQWTNDSSVRDVREFFVVRRHRRSGVGEALAHHIWGAQRGEWLVRVLEANLPALPFWKKVIAGYTNGRYAEKTVTSSDGHRRVFFSFDNRDG